MQIRNEIMHFQIKQVRHSVMSNKRKNFQIKQSAV